MKKRIIVTANYPQISSVVDVINEDIVEHISIVTNVRQNPVLETLLSHHKLIKIWDYYETQSIEFWGNQEFLEIAEDHYNRVSPLLLLAMDMLSRNDQKKFRDYQSRKSFVWGMLGYCLGYMKSQNINILIFNSTPHTIFHFCLYIAAEILQIKRFMFYRFPIVNGIHPLYYCFEDIFRQTETMVKFEEKTNLNIYLEKKETLFSNSFLGTEKVAAPSLTSKIRNKFTELSKVWTSEMGMSELVFHLSKLFGKEKRQNLHYSDADIDVEYVLFPLHYQPECSTNPMGGRFENQLAAIRFLQNYLDDAVKIYVKPHPRVSKFSAHFNSVLDDRTILINNKIPVAKLVECSKMVACITGTTGFFAALIGKPVLCFGHIFYESLPNVKAIRTANDGNGIDEFMREKRATEGQIREALNQMSHFAISGARDNRYVAQTNIDVAANNANYSKIILELLYRT